MTSAKKLRSLADGEVYAVHVERPNGMDADMDADHDIDIGGGHRVWCDAPAFEASVAGAGEAGVWSVLTENGSYETRVTLDNGDIHVEVGGERFSFALDADVTGDTTQAAAARAEVKAPMPGKIVKLLVASGDTVNSGQGIVLFEAMKMQNEIKSPQDGVVGEIAVEEGQAVEARDRLFVVEALS